MHRIASVLLVALFLSISGCEEPDNWYERGAADIRVMSWNVKRNSILPPNDVRRESFKRIVRAMDPDVIALQEIVWPELPKHFPTIMNELMPLPEGMSWHVHALSDNVLISRYPMRWRNGDRAVPLPLPQFGLPDFHLGFATAVLELPDAGEMLVVATHNKSGANPEDVQMRQIQADTIVGWIRAAREPSREQSIAEGTPIVLLGDFNAVPDASMAPLETLISGDIADEESFGPDIRIDWDKTDIADASPSHNAMNVEYYTWRNDALPFPPSALDRVLYTDSVMSVRNSFILNTMTLTPEDLAALGLHKSDVLYDEESGYYDHLPIIVDFEIHRR